MHGPGIVCFFEFASFRYSNPFHEPFTGRLMPDSCPSLDRRSGTQNIGASSLDHRAQSHSPEAPCILVRELSQWPRYTIGFSLINSSSFAVGVVGACYLVSESSFSRVKHFSGKTQTNKYACVVTVVTPQMHSYAKKCIATGGGIVTVPQNWGKLQTGIVVWLDMEVKLERVSCDVARTSFLHTCDFSVVSRG